jgi:predicted transcriptional regulator
VPTEKTARTGDRAELERLLYELDITNDEAARCSGVAIQTVYRWTNGTSPIPLAVVRMLQLMLLIKGTENMIRVKWCEPPPDRELT